MKKEVNGIKEISTDINPQIALDFLNSYINNCNKMRDAIGTLKWIKETPFATKSLKNTLEKLIANARSKNPELGLDFDPIFDAQDYPSKGVKLLNFNSETGYATVQGINWESFKVTIKVVNQNGQSLVDGCGIINIPENKRAKR